MRNLGLPALLSSQIVVAIGYEMDRHYELSRVRYF